MGKQGPDILGSKMHVGEIMAIGPTERFYRSDMSFVVVFLRQGLLM
jgi:hypothetical protein